MLDAMESAQPWTTTYNTRFVEYEAKMTELINPIWSGQQAPTKSYLDECDRQLQQILDLPMPGAS
jgi:hypothetical protein